MDIGKEKPIIRVEPEPLPKVIPLPEPEEAPISVPNWPVKDPAKIPVTPRW